jgi:hypothetical protein
VLHEWFASPIAGAGAHVPLSARLRSVRTRNSADAHRTSTAERRTGRASQASPVPPASDVCVAGSALPRVARALCRAYRSDVSFGVSFCRAYRKKPSFLRKNGSLYVALICQHQVSALPGNSHDPCTQTLQESREPRLLLGGTRIERRDRDGEARCSHPRATAAVHTREQPASPSAAPRAALNLLVLPFCCFSKNRALGGGGRKGRGGAQDALSLTCQRCWVAAARDAPLRLARAVRINTEARRTEERAVSWPSSSRPARSAVGR